MTLDESQNDERQDAWHGCMNGEDAPPADTETLPPEQQRQLADEQFLHALLRHRYSESESSTARRVDRVLKAISPRPARPLWLRLTSATVSSAAALILVVVLIDLLLPRTTSATSDFDRVVSAFLDDGDRAYSIQFTMQRTDDGEVDSSLSAEAPRPARAMRPHGPGKLNGATLYLRGYDQYVFEIKLPRDRTVWIGQDGQNAWAVHPHGPVYLSKDRDAFRLPFFEEMTTIPLIDVRDTLQAAKQGYELEPPKKVTLEDGREAEYFVARREGQAGRRPQRIELWADPKTGLLYRMVCSQIHFGGLRCRQLRLDYLSGKSLPANWFEYTGHAAPDADVKTVTKQDIQRFRREQHKMRQERRKRHPYRQSPHRRNWKRRRPASNRLAPPEREPGKLNP